jgi:hypothetical protein
MNPARPLGKLIAFLSLLCSAGMTRADPWLAPGDEGLRSDIQLLADAGVLRGPTNTWPLSWPDVARDALAATADGFDEAVGRALRRVQRQSRRASEMGFGGLEVRAAGATDPLELRAFGDTPREQGEAGVRASWLTRHFALNLQATAVVDPSDGMTLRPDGSYLGVSLGNFMISAGFMERWWGPGWDGSLIMSTNARPIPSITLERNYTEPFKTPLLSWIGPWRASIAVGEAEEHGVSVPRVRFLAARVNFKPRPWLEVGLTRTAQWCGEGRPCGWSTFKDLVLGQDNTSEGADREDEPGNQMAGYDLRIQSPWRRLPAAFYTQWIGEDEAGGLPSKFLGLFGLEYWDSTPVGGLRLRAEYVDTTCVFTREDPQFNCGYRNSLYPDGYVYRGRVIGHSLDNDSRMLSLGGLLTRANGAVFSLTLRRAEVNRDGGDHAISNVPVDFDNVELRYSRGLGAGKLSFGVGYLSASGSDDAGSRVHGFAGWQQGF